ncbi:hypothetical protein PVAND_015601 [Polypedilum vanderplanki]|uniref:DUF229 domain containing protein n=1 Tax=Polypedilum vanderplanki TaxID=319348 RepID=A0A9J6BDM6_POLVA|nr:hypothetical protein PVAND_015601 [Polypedilum vanderplanki]
MNLKILLSFAFFFFLITLCCCENDLEIEKLSDDLPKIDPEVYLINGENCKIPDLDPFSDDAMKVYKPVPAKRCSEKEPMVSTEYSEDGKRLIINDTNAQFFLESWMTDYDCCLERITRPESGKNADNHYILSDCINFSSGYLLTDDDEFILIKCRGFSNTTNFRVKNNIYKDVFGSINTKVNTTEKLQNSKVKNKTNVLLIGIDSISRLNLIRAMPETYEYVKRDGWIEMKAFNKVGDNTFPNFMALLAGLNHSLSYRKCNPKKVGGIDDCGMLWNLFNEANYATAFAEDCASLATFNFFTTGFSLQPTDHYMRPMELVGEKHLTLKRESFWNTQCLGYRHYADYVYDYANEFVRKYKNDSFFGFFWTNSFSHDDVSMPKRYDSTMKNHLENIEKSGVLNNTIIIFLSDHGMRFGPIRKFFTGWLEERLPFLHIYIPQQFKAQHPELVKNLEINADRLISPYDMFVTFKHILMLSGEYNETMTLTADGCPTCQSLFYEVPSNRTCKDACIPRVWCTCTSFSEINKNSDLIKKAANFAVTQLNEDLSIYPQCAKLELKNVLSARRSTTTNSILDFLVSFDVMPSEGEMEATVRYSSDSKEMKLIGEISRINKYGNQSSCILDAHLRKYCYCM